MTSLEFIEKENWTIKINNDKYFVITQPHPIIKDVYFRITIDKEIKQYVLTMYNSSNKQTLHIQTTIKIHRLLTKLFKVWGWIDE